MKKLVFLLSALSLMACNKNEDDEKVVAEKEVSIPAGAFYKSVAVEVPEGQKAEVYVGGMKTSEICGPTSTEVLVPANAMAVDGLRAVDMSELAYEVKFIPFSGTDGDVHTMQSTIAFEDLRENIDGDYNDLVVDIWSNMELVSTDEGVTVKVKWKEITPKAMGAEYDMAFGCKVALFDKTSGKMVGQKDVILSGDVRKDYFKGTVGLLNTEKEGLLVETSAVSMYNEDIVTFKRVNKKNVACHLIYFIDVVNTGWRHYAVAATETANNSNFDLASLDGEVLGLVANQDVKHALGLYMPSSLKFAYPIEKMSIFKAYPKFGEWLANPESKINPFENPVEDNVYKMD
jgi:hypothetical protein